MRLAFFSVSAEALATRMVVTATAEVAAAGS